MMTFAPAGSPPANTDMFPTASPTPQQRKTDKLQIPALTYEQFVFWLKGYSMTAPLPEEVLQHLTAVKIGGR